jgi:hypothetical protein
VADQTRARADAALSEKSASAATALAQQHRKMQSAADKARARAEAELQGLHSLNAATAALADDVAISNARERAVSDAAVAAAECKLTSAESKLTAMGAKLGEEAAAASARVLALESDVQALTVQLVQLRLVGNVGARASAADCRVSAECVVVKVDEVATLREQVSELMVTTTDREERLRRIAVCLDADYDDYYLGVVARVTVPTTSSQHGETDENHTPCCWRCLFGHDCSRRNARFERADL